MRADLRGIGVFADLAEADLEALAGCLEERTFEPGAAVFREGDAGRELYVLVEGSVSVSVRSGDGEAVELSRLASGASFGEMALLEPAPRSATCVALEKSRCLVLGPAALEDLLVRAPRAAAGLLEGLLRLQASRLLSTGAFVTQLVQWGEEARLRALTDEATGLFNRRHLEDSFESILAEASREGRGLSFAMFDLDRFGTLNRDWGPAFCDGLILEAARIFRTAFAEGDLLVRYGGDEFCFILQGSRAEAEGRCEAVCAGFRSLYFPGRPGLRVTASLGVARFPEDGRSPADLMTAADKALYAAKEAGRDRVVAYPDRTVEEQKRDIPRLAAKNRVAERLIAALTELDSFVVAGHKDPDDDCVASMVAFALLASKFSKKATIVLAGSVQDNYDYLLSICRFNGIEVLREGPVPQASALVLVDTPKPSMIERRDLLAALEADPAVPKIELDHHLAADSRYWGDRDYRLVYEASSTCEIIGSLALKIEGRKALLERFGIEELLSRNLVLAILTGMIGDSQLGRFLKTRREAWFYRRFAAIFEARLASTTTEGRGNFSSMEEVYQALVALSRTEEACYRIFAAAVAREGDVGYAVLGPEASRRLFEDYDKDTVIAVAKVLVDRLAEDSGRLGLVGYYDDAAFSDLVQFRLRRAQGYGALDLREVLPRLGITNGGGHPGAVGFRVEKGAMPDIVQAATTYGRILTELGAAAARAGAAPKA